MIQIRPSDARGYADHGWLRAKHSFSFADYYDPAEMGWGALRVINEDRVGAGLGFGRRGEREMEDGTYYRYNPRRNREFQKVQSEQ